MSKPTSQESNPGRGRPSPPARAGEGFGYRAGGEGEGGDPIKLASLPSPARAGEGFGYRAGGEGEGGDPIATGVVLAAGPSLRFLDAASEDPCLHTIKQLLELDGEPLVRRAARAALDSRLGQVLVIVGCRAEAVSERVGDLPVEIVTNPDFEEGQSSSVRAALPRIDPRAGAAMFIPCDQPFLDGGTIDRILARHEATGAAIVVPVAEGRRGAPVLFARPLFAELGRIVGDAGGRQLFERHRASVVEVELPSELPLQDIDTPADFRRLVRHAF